MSSVKERNEVVSATADRQLILTRLLNAPVELVWEVWTTPDHIKHWWGPNGFSNTISSMHLEPGGEWNLTMHGPDGTDYKNKSLFKEIIKHKKIVYEHISGPRFLATIEFEKKGEKTFLTWHMLFESREEFIRTVKTFKADEGLKQNVSKLETYLQKGYPTDELTLTRTINAPRELVFKAWTDVQMLAKWWGPGGFTNPICEWEAKPNGKIFIEMKASNGKIFPMDGEVHEIIAPEKIVFTSAALDENNERLFEVMNTVTLKEENGKTRLNIHLKISKIKPGGEQMVKGINEGWSQSLERLINLVE